MQEISNPLLRRNIIAVTDDIATKQQPIRAFPGCLADGCQNICAGDLFAVLVLGNGGLTGFQKLGKLGLRHLQFFPGTFYALPKFCFVNRIYAAWLAPDGSKIDEADLKVLNPTFITSAADLQHLADKHAANPTMAKPIREYAVKHSLNVRILDVEAPLKAMNTLKMFAQKALNDFNGYSANCLANDKFCQRLIDLAAVMDGKIVLANTIEE